MTEAIAFKTSKGQQDALKISNKRKKIIEKNKNKQQNSICTHTDTHTYKSLGI